MAKRLRAEVKATWHSNSPPRDANGKRVQGGGHLAFGVRLLIVNSNRRVSSKAVTES